MKKLLSSILALTMVFSLSSTAFASDQASQPLTEQNEMRISREVLDKVRENAPAMSEAQAQQATDLISQKASAEHLNTIEAAKQPYGAKSVSPEMAERTQEINDIEAELESMGAIPLTIEDVYALNGLAYRPGAPDVPDDTNYVNFYGLTSYIGNHEVWSIVAYSAGYDQSDISVPFYKDGQEVMFNTDSYVEGDFRQYIDLAANAGSTFAEEAFDSMPVLGYIGDAWTLSTFFNPTATQKITLDYDANQLYIYSYVAEESVGYFDFVMAVERIQGSCVLICRKYDASGSRVESAPAGSYEVRGNHYADYSHAVDLYKSGVTNYAYYVGPIKFYYDGQELARISMPKYSSLWTIPGI